MHLLRVIANPRDEVSLAVVLRSPLVAVSDEALLALRLLAENSPPALENCIIFIGFGDCRCNACLRSS